MTKIVLVDHHKMLVCFMRASLVKYPDFRIGGVAYDGLRAVEVVDELKPDIIVQELMMPGINGLDVAQQISNRPGLGIVILGSVSF